MAADSSPCHAQTEKDGVSTDRTIVQCPHASFLTLPEAAMNELGYRLLHLSTAGLNA